MPWRLLLEGEEQDLCVNLQSLLRNTALRKLNDLIKRARLIKVSDSVCDQEQGRWTVCSVLAAAEETSDKTRRLLQKPQNVKPIAIQESAANLNILQRQGTTFISGRLRF